jgi:hypothetical protein
MDETRFDNHRALRCPISVKNMLDIFNRCEPKSSVENGGKPRPKLKAKAH